MSEPPRAQESNRRIRLWESAGKAVLLVAFAALMFFAGRLWSYREVEEARGAAGIAERERLALRAELIDCRNALRLRGPLDRGPHGGATGSRAPLDPSGRGE